MKRLTPKELNQIVSDLRTFVVTLTVHLDDGPKVLETVEVQGAYAARLKAIVWLESSPREKDSRGYGVSIVEKGAAK